MLENQFVIIKCDGEVLRSHNKAIADTERWKEAHDDCSTEDSVIPLSELPTELLNVLLIRLKN